MRFIAAIPNYNHGKSLVNLIKQLQKENLDKIYVLDDASTDDSLELLKQFKDIEVVKAPYNGGPGANRNRIIRFLKKGDIVMFIDADMVLLTKGVRPIIEKLFSQNKHVGMFGGGIEDKEGLPMTYNYGRHQSQTRHATGLTIEKICTAVKLKPFVALLRPLAKKYTYNVEIRFYEPKERFVDTVSEAHFYIKGDDFKALNGFDERLRYHEGGEFAYRLRHSGSLIKFTPEVWAKHLQINSRTNLRRKEAKNLKEVMKEGQNQKI